MSLDPVLNFLAADHSFDIGYSGLYFYDTAELESEQIGYKTDENGKLLVSTEADGWQQDWLVIGHDELMEDPIFIDTKTKELSVRYAIHNEGKWEHYKIADSFDNFKGIVTQLKTLAKHRENPIALESNPLPQTEYEKFMQHIEANNPGADMVYWKGFFEVD